MSDQSENNQTTIVVQSTRFGELEVSVDSQIELPCGLIGFPSFTKFIMLEHKPPFYWLHSIEDAGLAFVVIDGAELLQNYNISIPYDDKDIDLKKEDDFATLVVVTVRPNPAETTANLKAPVFVNLRNRKGIQVIFDDPKLTTRFPLFSIAEEKTEEKSEDKK
jgi:flagellar assembly factor FliW